MAKAAILLLADTETHADMGRAANALTTVQEFAEQGDDVTLIFDGAGTRWAAELVKEESQLHPAFTKVQDRVAGA
jgi:predicted peroxiredoxin